MIPSVRFIDSEGLHQSLTDEVEARYDRRRERIRSRQLQGRYGSRSIEMMLPNPTYPGFMNWGERKPPQKSL